MKVIVFLIADGVLTGIMLYVVILLPNILLIIALPIQVFLFYIIILWMQKLMKGKIKIFINLNHLYFVNYRTYEET